MKSDLVQESFLKDYEKVSGYKAGFEFKTKMFASMRSQRTSLVPIFILRDLIAKVKLQVDEFLDISGAVVILDGDPEAGYPSLAEEYVPAAFKPLVVPPQVTVKTEVDELDIDDLEDLDPETVRVI